MTFQHEKSVDWSFCRINMKENFSQIWLQKDWFAPCFIFSELIRSGSGFWSDFSFNGDVFNFTSVLRFSSGLYVFSLVSAVELFWMLPNFNFQRMSPNVAARQHLRLLDVLLWWFPVCHSHSRRDDLSFVVWGLGCNLGTVSCHVLCVLFSRSNLSSWLHLPGKWTVCCIGSDTTSLCGVLRYATCLIGRVDSSEHSAKF